MSTNSTTVNLWVKRLPFAVILLAAALVLSLVLVGSQSVVRLSFAKLGNVSDVQRGIEADAARYTAMAESYAARSESVPPDIMADAARYTAMAEYYKAIAGNITPGIRADAARYTAMAAYYEALQAGNLRRIEAYAARYNAMAEFYAGK